VGGTWFDLRLAARSLARSPAYTLVSMTVLALGLGLTIFMFSAVKGFMLSPLPFHQPERIMQVGTVEPGPVLDNVAAPAEYFEEWREHQQVFERLAGYYSGTVNLSGDDRPERYSGAYVTADFFAVLGIAPARGRSFVPEDEYRNAPTVAIISDQLWRHRYNESPGIVGTHIRVNGRNAEIVGVMPPGFHFPQVEDVWVPRTEGNEYPLVAFGRLRDGLNARQAQSVMQALHAEVHQRQPRADAPQEAEPIAVRPLAEEYVNDITRRIVLTLFASVVFVLLIACANAANLTLGRVAARRRELAIRASLGASRARLVGGILVESLLVGLAGAAIGVVLAEWGGAQLDRWLLAVEATMPYWVDWSLDGKVIGFAVAAGLGSAMVAGFLPAWRATRVDLNNSLRDGGYGSSDARRGRLARILVTFQLGLCTVLLICAGLTLRSVNHMSAVDDGLGNHNALTGRIGLFETSHAESSELAEVYRRLEEELAGLPGVRHAAVASALPFTGAPSTPAVRADAEVVPGTRPPSVRRVAVSPAYFEAFGIPLRQGRHFTGADDLGAPRVAIVNAAMAEREWPGRDAVGEQLRIGAGGDELLTVVGVVGNFLHGHDDLRHGTLPAMYLPLAQAPPRFVSFAVSVTGDPNRFGEQVRDAMLRVDADTPIYWLRTYQQVLSVVTFDQRLIAYLFTIFSAIAVLLTVTGLYAVLAYAVGQRTREIGVRRALGAHDASIVRMIVGQGWRQYLVGAGVGLVVAAAFAQLIRSELVGVGSFDPLTFGGVVGALGLIVLVASLVPAKRALRVQPIVALRQD
jgi:putative ABC transport system permease protein